MTDEILWSKISESPENMNKENFQQGQVEATYWYERVTKRWMRTWQEK